MNKSNQQVQKYHRLLVEGFVSNGYDVDSISTPSNNKELTNKFFIKLDNDVYGNVKYHYLTYIKFKWLKYLVVFSESFFKVFWMSLKNKNAVIICDSLNLSAVLGALIASKITNRKSIGIVTDLPKYLNSSNSIFSMISFFIIRFFSGYVFITKFMSDQIKVNKKPFVVIEGHVDAQMDLINNDYNKKYNQFVFLYAGNLDKCQGIDKFIDAFMSVCNAKTELHIYGDGDYSSIIREIANQIPNIKYFGIKDNFYVVQEQLKATVLINPRPSDEEFALYSFPSKNMEYMVSGTPLLTTKLPGMPSEYLDFVYLIKDESIEGIKKVILEVIGINRLDLHAMGEKCKKFVLEEKSNIVQSKKIIELFK